VLFENSIIKDDFQEEPPLVSNETTSQETKRVPGTYIGRDSNSNSSSITGSRRRNIAEGTPILETDSSYPQRGWLSQIGGSENYFFDSIGGEGSFVYVIDLGINEHHHVSNFFRFTGFF
jgi:hypothetical protein